MDNILRGKAEHGKAVKEIHIRTADFEKGFIALQQLALPLKLNSVSTNTPRFL